MAAATTIPEITWADKTNTGTSYPEKWWRSLDAQEVKNKFNALATLVKTTRRPVRQTITSSSYDVLASDEGTVLYVNVDCTIVLPDVQGDINGDAIVDFSNITVICGQDGINVDFETTASNPIVSKNSYYRLTGRGAAATCYYAAINNFWNLFGDLTDSGSGSGSASGSGS